MGRPIDPKVLEEQQKKLQEELQKRAEDERKRLEAAKPGQASPQLTARADTIGHGCGGIARLAPPPRIGPPVIAFSKSSVYGVWTGRV